MSSGERVSLPFSGELEPQPIQTELPRIKGYEVDAVIGKGGMGEVYRARQLSTNREVALKTIGVGVFDSDESRARFAREVELTAGLSHIGIVTVYESGLADGMFWYSMELVEGLPLDEYVSDRSLDRDAILSLVARVCNSVDYAHRRGVIHRDLKPGNILVNADEEVKVLDFGLARRFDEQEQISVDLSEETRSDKELTKAGRRPGTPAYLPVCDLNEESTTRTDVYSLGVILYGLLNGRPQQGEDLDELVDRIRHGDFYGSNRSIDGELAAILRKALEQNPDDRYGSAGEIAEDILNYKTHYPLIASMPYGMWYIFRKSFYRHLGKIATVFITICLIAVLMGVGLVFYSGPLSEEESAELSKVTEDLRNGSLVDKSIGNGLTRLHMAAKNGHAAVAEFLIEKGANVNVTDNYNWAPLHFAAMHGQEEVVKLFLENGARVDIKSKQDWTPLHQAARHGHSDVAKLLVRDGADVNAETKSQWRPLHCAAGNGHARVIKLLIESGADMRLKNGKQRTALHFAVIGGHLNAARELISHGSPLNSSDKDNRRPLHFAARGGYVAIVELLIANGADVTMVDKQGLTALRYAETEVKIMTSRLKRISPESQDPEHIQRLIDIKEVVSFIKRQM